MRPPGQGGRAPAGVDFRVSWASVPPVPGRRRGRKGGAASIFLSPTCTKNNQKKQCITGGSWATPSTPNKPSSRTVYPRTLPRVSSPSFNLPHSSPAYLHASAAEPTWNLTPGQLRLGNGTDGRIQQHELMSLTVCPARPRSTVKLRPREVRFISPPRSM